MSGSIAASISRNEINNTVDAYITGTPSVTATAGGIEVRATADAAITATSVAASLAFSAGSSSAISISGAGAESTNVIHGNVKAHIENSPIDMGGNLALVAINDSGISATVVAVSGGAASIGAAVSRNLIGYDIDGNKDAVDVLAYVEDAPIHIGGNLTQTAISRQSITAGCRRRIGWRGGRDGKRR